MGPAISQAGRSWRAVVWAFALVVVLIVSGCGPLGGDDEPEEPLVTVEPTEQTEAGTPESIPDAELQATPGFEANTPDDSLENGRVPATPEPDTNSTNPANPNTGHGDDATPIATRNVGDGTSGATPDPTGGDETPDEGLDEDGGAALEATDTVSVASCSPGDVPEFSGASDAFVVTEELNFRAGPGSDCESIGDEPLAPGEQLVVTSDPVVREGEGDTLRVRVNVGGEQGWVAVEFVEPLP